ncbi:MAG: small subunit ribosomal protein S6 [Chitinophagaceae bacterium]|nr:MAG: small subunit ribosomal protein S6 [Chitinophagaceae bacterium]
MPPQICYWQIFQPRLKSTGTNQFLTKKIQVMNNYELMVIFTPVLSEEDFKTSQKKYQDLIAELGGSTVHTNPWGLKSLAYPIQKKTTGIYWVLEFTLPAEGIEKLKIQLLRDEQVMRHMVTRLDKYAVEYNYTKRNGGFAKLDKTEA